MSKQNKLREGSRRGIVHEADIARTTSTQIQDRTGHGEADRRKFNLRMPARYFDLLDTLSHRRAGRPSRNALIGEAVEMLLEREGML